MCVQKHIQGRSLYWRLIYGRVLQEGYQKNKPIYGGTSMLDLFKLTMMKFHYDIIHNSFEGRYNQIYSDTDSLVYKIHTITYTSGSKNTNHMLTSAILSEQTWKTMRTNELLGSSKMRPTVCRKLKFVALSPKCYSFKTSQEGPYDQ